MIAQEDRDPHYNPDGCNTFWGSHGCDLDFNHDGPCICGAKDPEGECSTYTPSEGVRLWTFDVYDDDTIANRELSELMPDFTAWGDNVPGWTYKEGQS